MRTPEKKAKAFVDEMSRIRNFSRNDREVREAYYSQGYRKAILDALGEVRKLCNQKQVVEMLEGLK
jgi:hypothetical protein